MYDLQGPLLLLLLRSIIALPELDIFRGADVGAAAVVARREEAVDMLAFLGRERGHAGI